MSLNVALAAMLKVVTVIVLSRLRVDMALAAMLNAQLIRRITTAMFVVMNAAVKCRTSCTQQC